MPRESPRWPWVAVATTYAAGIWVAAAVAEFLAVEWTFLVVEETARALDVVKDRLGCVRTFLKALLA